jgi:polysaccharide export outer membrane protein
MYKLSVAFLILSGVFSGLAGAETEQKPPAKAADKANKADGKSGASARTSVADGGTYEIGPEDLLLIRVWREPELSGQFPVRPDGFISLPLVNEVQASGLTPEQLAATIAKGLDRYMTQPEVSVAVLQVNSKKYFIIGEIQKPGAYPLTVPTTVLEALVNAGGFRDFANPKKIVVMRGNERFKFNYKEVIAGKKLEQNILLESGDQIIVP